MIGLFFVGCSLGGSASQVIGYVIPWLRHRLNVRITLISMLWFVYYSRSPPSNPSCSFILILRLMLQAIRNPTVMIVTLQAKDDTPLHVWAEMDTGSFENLISQALLDKLDRGADVNSRPEHPIKTIEGKTFVPKGDIDLSFVAGRKQKAFKSNFVIIEDNDVPLLLGRDMLFKELHVFTTDDEYTNQPVEDLKIFGKKPSADRVDELYMAPRPRR